MCVCVDVGGVVLSVCVCDLLIFLHRPLFRSQRGQGRDRQSENGNLVTKALAKHLHTIPFTAVRITPYMLNTRNEEPNNEFSSYLACFCEYIHLEYVRIHIIYRVNQAEYVIHTIAVAPQEYVNIYSTRRIHAFLFSVHSEAKAEVDR